MAYWQGRPVIVTGGDGFLGSHVTRKLAGLGAVVGKPSHADYDLTRLEDIDRMYKDHDGAQVVLHLAARVGGIGANRAHPGSFLYDNLMMGVQLMHQAYLRGIGKFVAVATVCGYPAHTSVGAGAARAQVLRQHGRRDQVARPGIPAAAGMLTGPGGLPDCLLAAACVAAAARQAAFCPSSTTWSPSRRTLVRMADRSLPAPGSLLRGLVRVPWRRAVNSARAWAERLSGLRAADADALLLDLIRGHLALLLGHRSASAVDAERGSLDLGMSSPTGVELRNRLNAETGLCLPATLIFDYPTPAGLARQMRAVLNPAGPTGRPLRRR